MMRRIAGMAGLALVLAAPAARGQDISMLKGVCSRTASHIAEGPAEKDLGKYRRPFTCDSAVVIKYPNEPGHVMVTFVNPKGGRDSPLSFAGVMPEGPLLEVANVYIGPNKTALAASHGFCKFFYEGSQITGIACAAEIEQGRRRLVPIVAFAAAKGP